MNFEAPFGIHLNRQNINILYMRTEHASRIASIGKLLFQVYRFPGLLLSAISADGRKCLKIRICFKRVII